MVNSFRLSKLICTNRILSNFASSSRPISYSTIASSNFTVKEIQIPLPKGHYLAGKLWRTTAGCGQISTAESPAPILCIHGWLDNAGSFDPLLTILMENSKTEMIVFAVDLPGHGFSTHSALTHYDTFMEGMLTILRVLSFMEWEKVTLLGHSLGSILSFIFTGTFPEYVDRYIALDTLHPVPLETISTLKRVTKSVLEIEKKLENATTPTYTFEEILQRTFIGRKETVTIEGCKTLLKRGSVQLPNGKYSFTHDLKVKIASGAGRFTVEQSNIIGSSIICPVCIVKGEPGADYEPRIDFMKGCENLKKNSKFVEFHLVNGTHHFHLNEPSLVAQIILNFLDRKNEF